MKNPEFESKHKRGQGGKFASKPNSGQPRAAAAHAIDLEPAAGKPASGLSNADAQILASMPEGSGAVIGVSGGRKGGAEVLDQPH